MLAVAAGLFLLLLLLLLLLLPLPPFLLLSAAAAPVAAPQKKRSAGRIFSQRLQNAAGAQSPSRKKQNKRNKTRIYKTKTIINTTQKQE